MHLKNWGRNVLFSVVAFFTSINLGYGFEKPEWGGYLESRTFFLMGKTAQVQAGMWNRAFLELNARANKSTKISLLLRGIQRTGFLTKSFTVTKDTDVFTVSTLPSEQILIDRCFADLNFNRLNLRIGKQLISWSFAYLFTPLDIYNPTYMVEPNFAVPGISALRSTVPLGSLTEFESIFVPGKTSEQSKISTRLITNIFSTDLGLNWAHNGQTDLLGFALKGDVEIGFWIEGAYLYKSEISRLQNKSIITLGADYTFPLKNGLYFMLEYSHDETGFKKDEYYQARLEGRTFLGKNYIALVSNYPFTNRIAASALFISNLNDQSKIFVPQIQWRPRVNLTFNFGAYLNFSKLGSEFAPDLPVALEDYERASQIFFWARTDF